MTILTHPEYPEIILTPSEDQEIYYGLADGYFAGVFRVIQEEWAWPKIDIDEEGNPFETDELEIQSSLKVDCLVEGDEEFWESKRPKETSQKVFHDCPF